jgi:adenine-specific DNA-methyltransferase
MNKTDLIQKVKALDGLSQDERAYLINLVNTKKKYGLVWEDKPEEVEEQLRDNLPILKEVKDKAIVNGEDYPNHILIEGDNLHALTALSFTHESKARLMLSILILHIIQEIKILNTTILLLTMKIVIVTASG